MRRTLLMACFNCIYIVYEYSGRSMRPRRCIWQIEDTHNSTEGGAHSISFLDGMRFVQRLGAPRVPHQWLKWTLILGLRREERLIFGSAKAYRDGRWTAVSSCMRRRLIARVVGFDLVHSGGICGEIFLLFKLFRYLIFLLSYIKYTNFRIAFKISMPTCQQTHRLCAFYTCRTHH